MAEIRYHLDEHMSHAVARELRRRGIDVETTVDAGLVSASDLEHLEHARVHGYVVVTRDADFTGLHYQSHSSRPTISSAVYVAWSGTSSSTISRLSAAEGSRRCRCVTGPDSASP